MSRAPSAAMSGSRSTSSTRRIDEKTVRAAQVAVPGPAPRSSMLVGDQPGLSEASSDSTLRVAERWPEVGLLGRPAVLPGRNQGGARSPARIGIVPTAPRQDHAGCPASRPARARPPPRRLAHGPVSASPLEFAHTSGRSAVLEILAPALTNHGNGRDAGAVRSKARAPQPQGRSGTRRSPLVEPRGAAGSRRRGLRSRTGIACHLGDRLEGGKVDAGKPPGLDVDAALLPGLAPGLPRCLPV